MRKVLRLLSTSLVVLGVVLVQPAVAQSYAGRTTGSWQEVTAPTGITTTSGIGVINDDDVWTFGHDARKASAAAHWDGTAWTPVPVPEFNDLSTFAARSSTDIWLGGRSRQGGSYLAHWDGKAWKVVEPDPRQSSVNAIAFAGDDIWVAGGCCGLPGWLTRWDGTQWHQVPIPIAPGGDPDDLRYVEGLTVTASGELIGVGMYRLRSTTIGPLLVRGGKDGAVRDEPPGGADGPVLSKVASLDGQNIYAAGYRYDPDNPSSVIYRRSGTTWSEEKVPQGAQAELFDLERTKSTLYASTGLDPQSYKTCTLRLNPQTTQWELIPHHGLSSTYALLTIAGSSASDTLWAFGEDKTGIHVKQYRP